MYVVNLVARYIPKFIGIQRNQTNETLLFYNVGVYFNSIYNQFRLYTFIFYSFSSFFYNVFNLDFISFIEKIGYFFFNNTWKSFY